MQFNNFFFVIALLATLAVAAPEPQTPAQTTAAAREIVSYIRALQTNPVALSLASELRTQPGASASIEQWQSSVLSQIQDGQRPTSNFYEALPTQVRSFFGSVYTAELSIASKNGITPVLPTSTSQAGAAQTAALIGAAGAVAGFAGVVMAL